MTISTEVPQAIKPKAPDGVLDFGFDFSQWLQADETITAATWTVPSGITKDSDNVSGGKCTIWLSGGTAGTTYDCKVHITTSDGSNQREDDRTLRVHVLER